MNILQEEVGKNVSGSVILRTSADEKTENENSMSLAKQVCFEIRLLIIILLYITMIIIVMYLY